MSAHEIVMRLRGMAADPSHRCALLNDKNCLPSVIQFLSNEDNEIHFTALEIVYLLTLHIENRQMMATEMTLMKLLKKFMMNGSLKEKKVAIASYTNLQNYTTDEMVVNSTEEPGTVEPKSRTNTVTGLTEKAINTYTIYVAGLNDDSSKKELESLLLNVKGIISIFCDLYEQKTVIRATITNTEIVEILCDAGKKASLRRKDLVSEDSGYFEETADQLSTSKTSWFGMSSLTRFGQEDKKKSSEGWVNRIGKALYIF